MAGDRKRQDYYRDLGRPLRMKPEESEDVRAHLVYLHDECGMTYQAIADASGMVCHSITGIVRNGRGILRENRAKLLAVQPTLRMEGLGPRVTEGQFSGARRRVRVLWVKGFPVQWMAATLPHFTDANLRHVVHGRSSRMHRRPYEAIVELYEKYRDVDPYDVVKPRESVTRAIARALSLNVEPADCWDEDTIDDPKAHPEWTGACGTPEGRAIHKRDDIPMCARCRSPRDKSFSYGEFDPDMMLHYMRRKELTQSGLAERAGLSWQTIQAYQIGNRVPPTSTLERLAEALGVRPETLVKDAG